MHEVSDELLMAYVDGELDPDQARLVEGRLATDEALKERIKPFVATRQLATLYKAPMDLPPPARVVSVLAETPVAHRPPTRADRLLDILRDGSFASLSVLMPLRMAGVLGLGAMLGWAAHMTSGRNATAGTEIAMVEGALVAVKTLYDTLESSVTATGVVSGAPGGDARTLWVTATFLATTGSYCREFAIGPSHASRYRGLGCRRADGVWEIHAYEKDKRKLGSSSVVRPAGATNSVVDAVVAEIMRGSIISPEAEARLMARGWKSD